MITFFSVINPGPSPCQAGRQCRGELIQHANVYVGCSWCPKRWHLECRQDGQDLWNMHKDGKQRALEGIWACAKDSCQKQRQAALDALTEDSADSSDGIEEIPNPAKKGPKHEEAAAQGTNMHHQHSEGLEDVSDTHTANGPIARFTEEGHDTADDNSLGARESPDDHRNDPMPSFANKRVHDAEQSRPKRNVSDVKCSGESDSSDSELGTWARDQGRRPRSPGGAVPLSERFKDQKEDSDSDSETGLGSRGKRRANPGKGRDVANKRVKTSD